MFISSRSVIKNNELRFLSSKSVPVLTKSRQKANCVLRLCAASDSSVDKSSTRLISACSPIVRTFRVVKNQTGRESIGDWVVYDIYICRRVVKQCA